MDAYATAGLPPLCGRLAVTGEGDRVTRGKIHLERRPLEAGRPVVVWPGCDGLYAAYDPAQIDRASAVEAVALLVPATPGLAAAGGRKDSSIEGIAEHGGLG